MKYINQDGHLSDESFALYSDAIKLNKVNQLPGELTNHLEFCNKCQQELVDFSSIMLDVEQPELAAHPSLSTSVANKQKQASKGKGISMYVKYAAAAAILLLLFFTYQQFQGIAEPEIVQEDKVKPEEKKDNLKPEIRDPDDQQLVQTPDSDEKKSSDVEDTPNTPKVNIEPAVNNRELYAANFTTNEEFETLIGTTFRSEDIEINTPKNNESFKVGTEITFDWKGTVPLNLIILDNEEETIYEASINSVPFRGLQNLEPGLYYWKLETEDDLFHLGKFTVE